jgi:hypothetical protein
MSAYRMLKKKDMNSLLRYEKFCIDQWRNYIFFGVFARGRVITMADPHRNYKLLKKSHSFIEFPFNWLKKLKKKFADRKKNNFFNLKYFLPPNRFFQPLGLCWK